MAPFCSQKAPLSRGGGVGGEEPDANMNSMFSRVLNDHKALGAGVQSPSREQ